MQMSGVRWQSPEWSPERPAARAAFLCSAGESQRGDRVGIKSAMAAGGRTRGPGQAENRLARQMVEMVATLLGPTFRELLCRSTKLRRKWALRLLSMALKHDSSGTDTPYSSQCKASLCYTSACDTATALDDATYDAVTPGSRSRPGDHVSRPIAHVTPQKLTMATDAGSTCERPRQHLRHRHQHHGSVKTCEGESARRAQDGGSAASREAAVPHG